MRKILKIIGILFLIELIGSIIIYPQEFIKIVKDFSAFISQNKPTDIVVFAAVLTSPFALMIPSIILYRNRHKIMGGKVGLGAYFCNFVWAAFLITPLFTLCPVLINHLKGEEMNYNYFFTLLYAVPPIVFFIFTSKGESFKENIKEFFSMLGIGICCPLFPVYKLLVDFFTSMSSKKSKITARTSVIKNGTTITGYHTEYCDDKGHKIGHSRSTVIDDCGTPGLHTEFYED